MTWQPSFYRYMWFTLKDKTEWVSDKPEILLQVGGQTFNTADECIDVGFEEHLELKGTRWKLLYLRSVSKDALENVYSSFLEGNLRSFGNEVTALFWTMGDLERQALSNFFPNNCTMDVDIDENGYHFI